MKKYNCYLFDGDGTLYNTAEMIYQCFLHTCKLFTETVPNRKDVISTIGLPFRTQFEGIIGPLSNTKFKKISNEHMRYQYEIYNKYLSLFPNVYATLHKLKNQGKKVAMVTSRRKKSLNMFLDALDIAKYFDILISPELTEKHKPDPEPALAAMQQLDVLPKETLFVGDAIYDIRCGNSAGCDTAFVLWSSNSTDTLNIPPTWTLKNISDLLD